MNLNKLIMVSAVAFTSIFGVFAQTKHTTEKRTMTPKDLLTMARVGSPSLSPDGKAVVYTIGFPSIENNKINSDIFTVNADGTSRKRLTTTDNGEYRPTWINKGKRIAFMSTKSGSMQLYSMNVNGEDIIQLTNVEGGISDYLFSDDEKTIAIVKDIPFDSNKGKNIYTDLPKTSGLVINDLMYRHWDEFVETIPHIFVGKVTPKGVSELKDILEGEPFEAPMKPFSGVEDIAFSADGKTIAYASRKKIGKEYALSTNSDIYLYDIEKGKTRNITEGMMGYDTFPKFSPDGKYIAWISMERDGYEADLKRLFIMDMQSKDRVYVSDGFEYDIDALQWAEDSKSIYFNSCIKAETQLFNIRFERKGKGLDLKRSTIEQITVGTHNYTSFELKNGVLIAGRQSMKVPTDLYNVDIKTGKATQITHENQNLLATLSDITVEKRWIKTTDGGEMLVWVILPPNFDKTKKYPALLYCQGGPQSTVSQFFSFRWNFRIMAEQGYVIVAPNRHGVPGFGKAWNEQISGDYPGQNMEDYLTAIDEVSKEPWVDNDHLGCVGASYGGFSVYYLAGNSGDRFKALVAHDGIFNMEMQYMTTEEMWFANWDMGGAPWDKGNKVAQRTFAHSPDKFIDKWKTPILVIHSGLDYRIDPSQGFAAFNAAQLRGVPSELLYFPDENHWVLKPQNAMLWQRTYFAWLDKWLKPDDINR